LIKKEEKIVELKYGKIGREASVTVKAVTGVFSVIYNDIIRV